MIRSVLIRVLVLGIALWLPIQAVAAASFSFCPATSSGEAHKNLSAPAGQMKCQHMPGGNSSNTACELCFSCLFCPVSFVGDSHSSLPLKPASVLGLNTSWSLVTFISTPPKQPPRTQVLSA